MRRPVSKRREEPRDEPTRGRPAPAEDFFDDIRDLEGALRIDEHALEEALRDQPALFHRVAKAYALEMSRRDAAKQALQDAEAAADLDVRGDAQRRERKVTEGEVRAMVQTDASVTRARDRLAALSESVNKLTALKEAFQHRSYALKDLVNLYVANYYTASEHSSAATHAVRQRDGMDARARMSEVRRGRGQE